MTGLDTPSRQLRIRDGIVVEEKVFDPLVDKINELESALEAARTVIDKIDAKVKATP